MTDTTAKQTLEEKHKNSSRRGSSIGIQSNPLEAEDSDSSKKIQVKVEDLSSAVAITSEQLEKLIGELKSKVDDNAAVLEHLDSEKTAFLFSCDHLLAMMELTTSIKTKLSMVTMIAPRITDPRAKSTEIANCFRFVNEKTVVEDVLKARAQTLQGSVFRRTGSFGGAGGMGGRGGSLATTGRGMSGRGGIGGRGGLLSNRTPSFSRGLTGSAKTGSTAAVVDGKDSTAPAVETAPMSQSEKIPAKRSVSSVFGAISETNSFA